MSAENKQTSFLDALQVPENAVLGDLLAEFNGLFVSTFKEIADAPSYALYLEALHQGTPPLIESIKNIGAFSYSKLYKKNAELDPKSDQLSNYIITFSWIESAKSLITLLRNVLFESQKAYILHLEHKVDDEKLEALKANSLHTIQNAYEDHSSLFQREKELIGSSPKAIDQKINQWALQDDPFPIYDQQLDQLNAQFFDLSEQQSLLIDLSKDFSKLKTLLLEAIELGKSEVEKIKEDSKKAISFIEQEIEKTGRINSFLDDIESQFIGTTSFEFFDRNLKNQIEETHGKSLLIIGARQGMLQRKEINFQKSISQWLDYEILPLLFKIWEKKDQIKGAMKLSFINIRNRIVVLSNEIKEGREVNINDHALEQPLVSFLSRTTEWEKELIELEATVHKKLEESFGVFSIYRPVAEFLPIPIESTIKKFRVNQNKWFVKGKDWLNDRLKTVQNLQTFVKQEEQLSVSEKIVRLIQSRKINLNENQYAGIFLTKGYIGESFIVGREAELLHINNSIQHWKSGFRGAVILSGVRFSGRSLFGDLVANRYFLKNTIRLQPNTLITLEGRPFTTSYDLEAALSFVKKYAKIGSTLVWIDDLELWNAPEFSLSRNIRKLNQFIDDQARQMFFMVSMTNWTKHHFNNIHQINKRFQTEINLDRMSKEEVREAILIRHGSTHKILVNKENEEEGPAFFQKQISKLYNTVEGNIGDALLNWSLSIHKGEGEKVFFKAPEPYFLPDLEDSDVYLVLSTLILEKRTNELRLKKLFGPAFKDKYTSILKRLHNTGLLYRSPDGSLEINDTIVNDVGRLLEQNNFLNFYHK